MIYMKGMRDIWKVYEYERSLSGKWNEYRMYIKDEW